MTAAVSNAGVSGIMPFITNFADSATVSLSPEGLLYYCRSRLSAIDTNIQQYFSEQKKANASMQDASKLISLMHEGTWGQGQLGSDQLKGKPECISMHAAKSNQLLDLYRSTESPEVKQKCAALFREVSGHDIGEYADPASKVSDDDIAKAVDGGLIPEVKETQRASEFEDIKSVQSDMSKSAEMNMIQLQSLVQQRQLAVQLTTQLMQTMHDTSKQVLGNIR